MVEWNMSGKENISNLFSYDMHITKTFNALKELEAYYTIIFAVLLNKYYFISNYDLTCHS